jgi:hypothetical protein
MNYRGIVVAALQCALVLSLAGKFAWDRERLPRVWVNVTPVDPYLPIRGRYVSLRVRVECDGPPDPYYWNPVRLTVENYRLRALRSERSTGLTMFRQANVCFLSQPVAFFIPEHALDPSRREKGEELWAEVSVPAEGLPRPIRLAVKKNGVLKPLDLR